MITHPNSKQPRVETDLTGALHVYVREPPIEGRANLAVINALAAAYHVKKNMVILTGGNTSKYKTFEIQGPQLK